MRYVSHAAVMQPSDFVMSEEGKATQDNIWVSVRAKMQSVA